jgi:ElaA protein
VIQIKPFKDLTPLELYTILKRRQDVFIAEQKIFYLDLDGKDVDSLHFWVHEENAHTILAYLRVVPDEGKKEISISRVLTIPAARSQGLARLLLKTAIEHWEVNYPTWTLHLHAQLYLDAFYKSLGFEATGPVFFYPDETPVPHVPMQYTKNR